MTEYAAPIAEAGKRSNAFLIESLAVGSIVTMAVITANIGGHPSIWQMDAVSKTATAVLKILPPNHTFCFNLASIPYNLHCLLLLLYAMGQVARRAIRLQTSRIRGTQSSFIFEKPPFSGE